MRCDPLGVGRHTEAQVKTILDWNAELLGLVRGVSSRLLALARRWLFLGGLIGLSLLFLLGFAILDLSLGLQPLQVRYDDRADLDGRLINFQVYLLSQQLLLSLGHIFGAHVEHILLSDVFAGPLLFLALSFKARQLLLGEDLAEILIRP